MRFGGRLSALLVSGALAGLAPWLTARAQENETPITGGDDGGSGGTSTEGPSSDGSGTSDPCGPNNVNCGGTTGGDYGDDDSGTGSSYGHGDYDDGGSTSSYGGGSYDTAPSEDDSADRGVPAVEQPAQAEQSLRTPYTFSVINISGPEPAGGASLVSFTSEPPPAEMRAMLRDAYRDDGTPPAPQPLLGDPSTLARTATASPPDDADGPRMVPVDGPRPTVGRPLDVTIDLRQDFNAANFDAPRGVAAISPTDELQHAGDATADAMRANVGRVAEENTRDRITPTFAHLSDAAGGIGGIENAQVVADVQAIVEVPTALGHPVQWLRETNQRVLDAPANVTAALAAAGDAAVSGVGALTSAAVGGLRSGLGSLLGL